MASGSEQEQDRTEPATPYKLREARKRGQVPKSLEINSLLILSAALLVVSFLGEKFAVGFLELSRSVLAGAGQWELEASTSPALFEHTFSNLIGIMWPFVGAVMLIGIVANISQTGPIFSFFPIKPDFKRINPVNGFKRLFSKKLLFESAKTIIKMVIFGAILYFALSALIPSLLALIDIDPKAYPIKMLEHGRSLAYKLLLAILVIALLDLLYSRHEFSQRMRMSRRELKEEVKRREGDPQVRSRRRQLQKEAVDRAGAVKRVPDADVLITNPTHLSIALRYDAETSAAPVVLAKGAGDLALKMRAVARKHHVPLVENKALAQELFKTVPLEETVPEALFPTVAKILAWVYLQREGRTVAGAPA